MNLPFFIARRLSRSKENATSSSKVMVRIAIVSIALSITVMILAIGVVGGFKHVLTEKISGFAGDIQLTLRSAENPSMIVPFTLDRGVIEDIESIDGVRKIEGYATVKGLLQTENGVEGIILRGAGTDYDWSFVRQYIVEGEIPVYSDSVRSREAILPARIASKMGLSVGDVFKIIVINENPRRDRFRVAAIYDSGLSEFDSKLLIGDISTVRRVNNWGDTDVEGYQIFTNGTEEVYEKIYETLPNERWNLESLRHNYIQFFDWIEMLELNASFILVIMLIVAVINMLCGVLVIVLESVRMIGVLKTQGITFGMLQRIFLYRSSYIVLWGLFWGNLIGIGLCALQYYFGIITLDADAYLLSEVPIWLSWSRVLAINLGSFVVITLLMIIPTTLVNRISPADSVKYS